MIKKAVQISGFGTYLPERKVSSTSLDLEFGLAEGTLEKQTGVANRHFASKTESNSWMGAQACVRALKEANLDLSQIDAIVGANGSFEQIIPCTAALVQRELGEEALGIACFDVNATCLSFMIGLDQLAWGVQAGQFRNVLLVSTEIASQSLDRRTPSLFGLFGDGAAACVISPAQSGSKILGSVFQTFADGWDACQIEGGGNRYHPRDYQLEQEHRFTFTMDGKKAFKFAYEKLPAAVDQVLMQTQLTLEDFALVVPHQASGRALGLMRAHLKIPEEKWMNTLTHCGNMIAASIPVAFHEAVKQNRIKRGDRVLLLGTSAGYSQGVLALEY
jgi:3-oxoacyl-[acyl-carrier-protein] synthase-3